MRVELKRKKKKRKREKERIIHKKYEKTESLKRDNNRTHLSWGDEKEEEKVK